MAPVLMANLPTEDSKPACGKRPASAVGYDPEEEDSEEDRKIGMAAWLLEAEDKSRSWKCAGCHRSDVSKVPVDNGVACVFCYNVRRLQLLGSDLDVPNTTRRTVELMLERGIELMMKEKEASLACRAAERSAQPAVPHASSSSKASEVALPAAPVHSAYDRMIPHTPVVPPPKAENPLAPRFFAGRVIHKG